MNSEGEFVQRMFEMQSIRICEVLRAARINSLRRAFWIRSRKKKAPEIRRRLCLQDFHLAGLGALKDLSQSPP